MRKSLFSIFTVAFVFTVVLSSLLPNVANAQCGVSAFQEGGTLSPTGTWTNVSVGSGTYVNVNTLPGRIYSFEYVTNSAVLPYVWDMTLSTSSGVLNYNNSLTPIQDPWTGGQCPIAVRPESAEWWSGSFNGILAINTNSWNGACAGYVPGQGSAILAYKECIPSTDPGSGVNSWNVDAFATADIAIPIPDARYGYYTDNNLNFVTTNSYPTLGSASDAPTWTGCEVPEDRAAIRARRTGFPCGLYTISDNAHDDNIQIYVNGSLIYNAAGGPPAGVVGNTNGYVLGSTDNVEIRLVDICTPGEANVGFNLLPLPAVNGGTIGGIADGSSVCEGLPIGNFTNILGATGGSVGFAEGGTFTYQWELSTDGGGTFAPVAGATGNSWNSSTLVPVGATYVIRRVATDKCGNSAVSNTISVIGRPTPNASMSPITQSVCPGTTASINITLSPGTGPFSIQYTDGLNPIFSATGLNSGDAITVTPPTDPTNYSFTGIVDFYGCIRTTGFTNGAVVDIIAPITYNSVTHTDVLCNGGNTGTITVSATGGNGGLEYSLDGITYQPSPIFTGLVAGTYNVYVRDNFGCVQPYGTPLTNVIVGEPADVTQTLVGVDASCANVFDGSITVTANGGIAPYRYTLNNGPLQPGNVFNGISAGSYLVSVYDSNNCLDTASITISNTYIISVDLDSQTNVSCVGFGDGKFTVHVNGGIGPYQYSINGISYQDSGTFTGLVAGTYTVVGRDSKGCTESTTVTIAPPTPFTVVVDSVHNVLCNGSATGDIFISLTGGTPAFTYTWTPGGAGTEDLIGVAAGNYTVSVVDSKGCTTTGSASISQPLPLFLNVASYNDLLCAGDSSGAIDITANGGVPPYSYAWSNGETTEDIYGLKLGTFTVTVTDGNGCTATISQAIAEPTPITATLSVTDASCFGAADGAIDLSVSGGTPSYSFLWSTFATSEDLTGIEGGRIYNVIITDLNGCQFSQSVTVNEPTQLVLTTNVTQTSCFNTNDAAIDLTVTGGTPGYTYNWTNGATTEDLTGLGGGNYCVTVTDANGCSAVTCGVIVAPTPINASFIGKNPRCFGEANGSIDLIPSGGVYPYTFNWSNGVSSEDQDSIAAGVYIVTITDSRGCTRVDSTELVEPGAIFTSGFVKNVSCNGNKDGFIDITAYGGTLPYYFSWETNNQSVASTEDIGVLAGGDYYVTVTDANDCEAVSLYIVSEPSPLSVQLVATPVSCFGVCNGAVAAIPAGGSRPYEYLWNNFVGDSSQTGLCPGQMTVLLTDSNGCHLLDTISITQPGEILLNATVTNVLCNGGNTGEISLSVSGGTPGYTYVWSNGGNGPVNSNLFAGTYSVTVTDTRGCVKTATFTVTENPGMNTTVSIYNPACFDGNDGFVSVAVTGGLPPYIYNWSTSPSQLGATATNLTAGTYTLTVTDASGCLSTVLATVNNALPIVVTTTPTDSKCSNASTGTVTATATGGKAPYMYELNGIVKPTNVFTNLAPGDYVLVVRDANGCEGSQVFTISAATTLTVDLVAPQIVILQGMKVPLIANSNLPVVSHMWSPLQDPSDSTRSIFDFSACADATNCANPNVMPYVTTVFTVTVMNSDSCYASDTVSIIVESEPKAFVPSAFSPNGDGLNDRFEFDILGAESIDIEIFDRWGHKIYANPAQPNGITGTNGWDGTIDGKVAPFDTYVWQMTIKPLESIKLLEKRSGTVTIMK
ncbi:MAG TPA: gliding motility-associated C-terminal domain-containing protein [Chitinophagales bacterium]|nr:gliding motility-associated C-terminal domain-containing protein [Chitinophagales bacterium]